MQIPSEPSLVHAQRSHRGEVTCVDLFGGRLISGGGDRTLRLWRWTQSAGWEETAVATAAHRYGVTGARWSQAGVLVASAGVDGAARLWCGRTLKPRRAMLAPGATAVRSLCWAGDSASGGRLLTGHDDGALCVWHVARGLLLARVVAHEGALHALCAPARGGLVLTACTHGVLKVFDLTEICEGGDGERTGGQQSHAVPLTWVDCVHDLGALCADVSHDGVLVATGGHDAQIRLWHVATEVRGVAEWSPPLEGHSAAVTALRWATGPPPCGRVLSSASLDRTARLWSASSGSCLHVVLAHSRYLTCISIAHDLRCLVTGSNDKSIRTWTLGPFSLGDELEPECSVTAHFALGDLQGIQPPVEEDEQSSDGKEESVGPEARHLWYAERAHSGAINCIATYREVLATASSDGLVRVWRWCAASGELSNEHTLDAHHYPVLATALGASGQILLTAGLDGGAYIWDVKSGVQLRSLCVPTSGGGVGGGEAGGGGVRGAAVSPHRPPLLLLATDDGLAPLWNLASQDPRPLHVFCGHTEAVTCCAWASDGRVVATGAASGELRVHSPPPHPTTLHHESPAHDLGVLSCDFAPSSSALSVPEGCHLLTTAGCDSLLKLWIVDLQSLEGLVEKASVRLVRQVEAHGGGVSCVRWGSAEWPLLASAGDDRCARVWRVAAAGTVVEPVAVVPASDVGGALAVALLSPLLLAIGGGGGELSLWSLPTQLEDLANVEEEGVIARFWGTAGVARWLREYVTRVPGSQTCHEAEAYLMQRVRDARVTGPRLLDHSIDELIVEFGYGADVSDMGGDEKEQLERAATSELLARELRWLRRTARPYPPALERCAPHELLCPLSHRLMHEPARAADGFTYERANIHEWFMASESGVSPMTGRRVRNTQVQPNYGARDALRTFLEEHGHGSTVDDVIVPP